MRTYIWYHMTALGAGILLDLAVGDPHWFPHPVRLIGAYISRLERRLYLDYCSYAWNDCEEDFEDAYIKDILRCRAVYEVKAYEENAGTK